MNSAFCFFGTIVIVVAGSTALADDQTTVRRSLLAQADRLKGAEEALLRLNRQIPEWLKLLTTDVLVIDAAARSRGAEMPDIYLHSLEHDTGLLSRVVPPGRNPTTEDIKRLRLAVASLHLKAERISKQETPVFRLTWAAGLPKKAKTREAVFVALQDGLASLEARQTDLFDMDHDVRDTLRRAAKDCSILHSLSQADGANISQAYLLSLTQDAHLLHLASQKETSVPVAFVYLQSVGDDLRVKVTSADQTKKKSPFDEVKTIVETKDRTQNAPMSGFEVWYVPKGLFGDPEEYKRFKQFSTPSVETRVPGCYEMWTRKNDTRGQEDDIDVKDDGTGECKVHLWIPTLAFDSESPRVRGVERCLC